MEIQGVNLHPAGKLLEQIEAQLAMRHPKLRRDPLTQNYTETSITREFAVLLLLGRQICSLKLIVASEGLSASFDGRAALRAQAHLKLLYGARTQATIKLS